MPQVYPTPYYKSMPKRDLVANLQVDAKVGSSCI